MKKIIGVCGSPRKKSSYTALKAALQAAEEIGGVETELIELRGKKLNFCIHCNQCLKKGTDYCTVYEDDMRPLYQKFYEADGIIIASPVYEMNITAQLATFFNRFRPTWNILSKDPEAFGKKVGAAIAVGGTRNGGQESTIQAIHGFFHTQGMMICNGGKIYGGASLWNPGDGSGEFEDEQGMKEAVYLGSKIARMVKEIGES